MILLCLKLVFKKATMIECPSGSGWPPGSSVGDPRPSPLFNAAAASFSVQSLPLLLLTVSSFSLSFGVFGTLWFPPISAAQPLLSSLCSSILCFSVVHRSSLSPLIEKKRERNRERRLPVISVTAEAFSEGITPDYPLAYLRRLDALLGHLFDFLPPVSPRRPKINKKYLISRCKKMNLLVYYEELHYNRKYFHDITTCFIFVIKYGSLSQRRETKLLPEEIILINPMENPKIHVNEQHNDDFCTGTRYYARCVGDNLAYEKTFVKG
ncbi:hypothetical protein M9H77_31983 [Catharanthus roseus]|uniref:Uncharacterized protein n=1 Tax=Catharanthus roseus TaxID=4058 RepID=A0ACC0A5H5_CATRO|nr:hypothetical protein M9H77_31983 [Catharanthus roseus]